MNTHKERALATLIAGLVMLAGCGRRDLPDLAPVSGKVTMDGKPLVGVLVSFYPENGRPGTAVTDDEGNYELMYIQGERGTKVGMNRIEITTIWPDGEPGPGEKETIPATYNTNSTLTYDVKPGKNVHDIELKSAGQ